MPEDKDLVGVLKVVLCGASQWLYDQLALSNHTLCYACGECACKLGGLSVCRGSIGSMLCGLMVAVYVMDTLPDLLL